MTHRQDIVWLDINADFEEIKSKIINNKHSIFLLCKDEIDEVLGVVYVKDLLPVYLQNQSLELLTYKKNVHFIPEVSKAYDVLAKFRHTKIHFAVVVDEYGVVVGIVTINDIINAIVGGISETNEFDYDIIKRADGSFLIDAQLPFEDFMEHFNIETFNREGYGGFHTLAGFILGYLKSLPLTGDRFVWNKMEFEIIDMDGILRMTKYWWKKIESDH